MREQLAKTATAAALGLALAFTFGCLEEEKSSSPGGLAAVIDQGSCSNAVTSDNTVYCGGQIYKTVKIGKQVWMAKNLNYDIPGNATDICYANIPANCAKYGRLYNWATAMNLPFKCNSVRSKDDADCAVKSPNHQGICPKGWHIPSRGEWNLLINTAGYPGLKAKSGWKDYVDNPCCSPHDCYPDCKKKKITRSGNGTDKYGFNALPGGNGEVDWWSSSDREECSVNDPGYCVDCYGITTDNNTDRQAQVDFGECYKGAFINVRCLKD
ncbi:MAG: hypothetical protein FWF67_05565 [Fibromonadales bacterium]|nr:hypothetical protein [Fibromonadales bacterium]